MIIFERDRKTNYVDANNRVLGYDSDQQCCEQHGSGVFRKEDKNLFFESATTRAHYDPPAPSGFSIQTEGYAFVDERPEPCGETLWFRLQKEGEADLFVCLWNFHNGYYSHGFEFSPKSGFLTEGGL